MHNLEDIIKRLESESSLTIQESFEIAQLCSSTVDTDEKLSRSLAINILNNWDKIPEETKELWGDIVESLGFYPYLLKENILLDSVPALLRMGLSESKYLKGKYFHDEQQKLSDVLNSGRNVVVSAPTSFGKSLLIEDVVASLKFSQIVIIQPTLALLDETRKKLLKYREHYKLIVRTSQSPSEEKGNIFLFTAERVSEYAFFTKIEFLIIDEFYKLSGKRDDDRSSSLNNAFYKLYRWSNPQFYFLGPNIDNISQEFIEKFNVFFYKTDYSLVESRTINIYENYTGKFGISGVKKLCKEKVLFDLLLSLKDDQTIIYCSSPSRVQYLACKFIEYLQSKNTGIEKLDFPLLEWIKINISEKWMLLDALKYSIGIHNGALQKHITTTIIDYFNSKKLRYLFCTSTIIEGVNTSAKNIIYFDKAKGPTKVDYFDYSNIKGRAGRLMEHYIGRIYNFNPPPLPTEIKIDIPFVDQNPIKNEVLIQLSDHEVKNKTTSQYRLIESIPEDEREVIRKNGINVMGQKIIIDELTRNIPVQSSMYNWTSFPNKSQLYSLLDMGWNNLLSEKEKEKVKPMTLGNLYHFTLDYMKYKSESRLITERVKYLSTQPCNHKKTEKQIYNDAVNYVFQVVRHWMQYKIPKWLTVINSLQLFVSDKLGTTPGNYLVFANLLENGFIADNLSIMLEYGIPRSAILKIAKYIPLDMDQDRILEFIKKEDLVNKSGLIKYEKNKILENIS